MILREAAQVGFGAGVRVGMPVCDLAIPLAIVTQNRKRLPSTLLTKAV